MKQYISYCFVIAMLLVVGSCKKKEYSMGSLTAPTDVTITTKIVGQDASHPNGDGSGDVQITLSGKNVLAYNIDYGSGNTVDAKYIPGSSITHKYTKLGINTYTITVTAYGAGATATTVVSKSIQVLSTFTPDPAIVTNLTGNSSKTWSVDKNVAGHFGVGPWNQDPAHPNDYLSPVWWKAGVNEKASDPCFYSAKFTFTQVAPGNYTLTVATPDGAFTKTGALAGGLPGIPSSGGEACYNYAGGTSTFSFAPSSSPIPASTPSTKVAIVLAGNNTFIGYGAVQKEYEILSISPTSIYLRVRGTETDNAWYLMLKAN